MKKIAKILKIAAFLFSILVFFIWLENTFEDEIRLTRSKMFWTIPEKINGISISDTKSDVYFKYGDIEPICSEVTCRWEGRTENGEILEYVFEGDSVVKITKYSDIFRQMWYMGSEVPFRNIAEMNYIMGKPTAYSESKDFKIRGYTYTSVYKKEKPVTFIFKKNELIGYQLGVVRFGQTTDIGRYVVNGKEVCPGESCPWNISGIVKPEFNDRNFTFFLQ